MSIDYENVFKKIAYDYEWERKEKEDWAKERSKETAIPAIKVLGIPTALGGALGGILGGAHGTPVSGGLKGALAGLALGAIIGMNDRAELHEAKKIVEMPELDRGQYLRSKARQEEGKERAREEESTYRRRQR